MKFRGITVCVEFHDLLQITLPHNLHHFDDFLVVTKPSDHATIEVCSRLGVDFFPTDIFTERGATFNKWAALEEGLDFFGRKGWLSIMDVDVLWPSEMPVPDHGRAGNPGKLYGPSRRILPMAWLREHGVPPESEWEKFSRFDEGELAGFTQIFHAEDPVLGRVPWHETNWKHAGGADSFFAMKWPRRNQVRLPVDVLHIGEPGVNWCGRVAEFVDGGKPESEAERATEMQQAWQRIAKGDYRTDRIW